MTKADYLNIASDLRRAAKWLWKNQKEKFPFVRKIIDEASLNKEVKKIFKQFGVVNNLTNKRFIAEQLLVSSIRLKNSVSGRI